MKLKYALIVFLFVMIMPKSNAQQDSIATKIKKSKTFLKKSILPVSLIIGGTLISGSGFERNFQRDVRNAVGNDFAFGFDDYARYAPIAEMYIADALGVPSKNHWFDQTKNLTIAIIVSDFITFRLKQSTNKRRPNGGDDLQSFPSGHTSFAFTNAGVLYQEFKNSSPLLAYSGYALATTTGAFRVMNNAHWISDVIVSAGIGILVTELVYLFDPIIKWNPFKKVKGVTLIPQIDHSQYGFYLSKTF
ncbi:phosphatase PAP2 family protein [Tamlana crocina]